MLHNGSFFYISWDLPDKANSCKQTYHLVLSIQQPSSAPCSAVSLVSLVRGFGKYQQGAQAMTGRHLDLTVLCQQL